MLEHRRVGKPFGAVGHRREHTDVADIGFARIGAFFVIDGMAGPAQEIVFVSDNFFLGVDQATGSAGHVSDASDNAFFAEHLFDTFEGNAGARRIFLSRHFFITIENLARGSGVRCDRDP